jgi:hypothetical protein
VTPQYSFSWDTSALGDGPASLVAKAYDSSGNIANSTSLTVNVANATPAQAVSEIILDNAALGVQDAAAGTSFVGTWCKSTSTGAYGSLSLYSCGATSAAYRWTPQLAAAGSYDVYVWYTSHVNRASSVPVNVTHQAGTTTKTVNQKSGGGKWVLLGRYDFAAGKTGYVEVKATGGQACADAVRFVAATGV